MSANVEFFCEVDKIEPVREIVKQFDKMSGAHYYDKDGNNIEVYFKREWWISDHIIFLNGKEISLNKLQEIFKSRNSMNVGFSFGQGSKLMLLISCHVENKAELLVLIDVLSEFLYDIFDVKVEF
jgi:hypothetical protein